MQCQSCGYDLETGSKKGVPSSVPCCMYCWRKVPIGERLRIGIACIDRSPGGVLNELTDVLARTIEFQQKAEDEI